MSVVDIEPNYHLEPLFVDLDGTLLRTDTLWEMWIRLLFSHPIRALLSLCKLLSSKALFKKKIAEQSDIDVGLLPVNPEFFDWLKDQHQSGRKLILATGADHFIAEKVAKHFGIFNKVLASDGEINLTGEKKLHACQRIAPNGFSYAGNESIDFYLWKHSNQVVVVNAKKSLRLKASKMRNTTFFDSQKPFKSLLEELRPHQWSKNILLAAVCITAHRLELLFTTKMLAAFSAFCMVASSIYIFNDLFDLWADRNHPKKKNRPLAKGDVSLVTACFVFPSLGLLGLGLSLFVGGEYFWWLLCYLCLTTLYSFWAKKIALLDIMLLGMLYSLRVVSGSVVTGISMSVWLGFFCLFLFISLATAKRVSELILSKENSFKVARRGYRSEDISFLSTLGMATGMISVLVTALYIQQPKIQDLYVQPNVIWIICLSTFYWVARMWLLTMRGEMNIDPIAFAIKDRVTYLVAFVTGLGLWVATVGTEAIFSKL